MGKKKEDFLKPVKKTRASSYESRVSADKKPKRKTKPVKYSTDDVKVEEIKKKKKKRKDVKDEDDEKKAKKGGIKIKVSDLDREAIKKRLKKKVKSKIAKDEDSDKKAKKGKKTKDSLALPKLKDKNSKGSKKKSKKKESEKT